MTNYKKTYNKILLRALLVFSNSKFNIITDTLIYIPINTPLHSFYYRNLIPVNEISGKGLFQQKRQRQ